MCGLPNRGAQRRATQVLGSHLTIAPTDNIAASTVVTALTWSKMKDCMFYIALSPPETA